MISDMHDKEALSFNVGHSKDTTYYMVSHQF